jgi:hypothetical protein
MFNPWMAFSLQAVRLGWEAQNVMASRWLRLVGSGAIATAEAERMVADKAETPAPAPRAPASPAIKEAIGLKPAAPKADAPKAAGPQAAAPKEAALKAAAPKAAALEVAAPKPAAPKVAARVATPKVAASALKVHKKRLGAKKRRRSK